jgi:hypothetical protein
LEAEVRMEKQVVFALNEILTLKIIVITWLVWLWQYNYVTNLKAEQRNTILPGTI